MSDYIIDAKTYLPKFMKDSTLLLSIVDCLNVLISKEEPVFAEIESAYNDLIYVNRDYSKLSYEAKINIIKELGFEYLLDMISLTSEQLTQLLLFFNLIYILKGKKEGLFLCLDLLDINYEYIVWDEEDPQGQQFTAKLKIYNPEFSQSNIFNSLRNFVRSYMLPWVDIIVEFTIEVPPFYVFSCGKTYSIKIGNKTIKCGDTRGFYHGYKYVYVNTPNKPGFEPVNQNRDPFAV